MSLKYETCKSESQSRLDAGYHDSFERDFSRQRHAYRDRKIWMVMKRTSDQTEEVFEALEAYFAEGLIDSLNRLIDARQDS